MSLTRRQWGLASLGAASALLSQSGCETPQPVATPTRPAADLAGVGVLERSIVLDLHCDTPMRIMEEHFTLGERHDYGQVDIPRMRDGGVTGVFFSIYTSATANTPLQAVKQALEIVNRVREEIEHYPQDLMLATTADEIVRAKQENKIAILMGVEGGHMIDSSLGVLRTLFRLGARYLTLTHTANTPWAGSSAGEPSSKGLNEFGRQVVQEMNRLGMMVDISHVSEQTFYDAIAASQAPIIASHSSCRALADHPRNLTDPMLKALAANGGVVHINYYNSFLDDDHRRRDGSSEELEAAGQAIRERYSNDPERRAAELRKLNGEKIARIGRVPLSRLLDHFEHAASVAGVDHVGLGSDFDGVEDQLPEGMEDISKIPALVAGLQQRGFSDPDIEKVLGANTLRVMREVERAARPAQS